MKYFKVAGYVRTFFLSPPAHDQQVVGLIVASYKGPGYEARLIGKSENSPLSLSQSRIASRPGTAQWAMGHGEL